MLAAAQGHSSVMKFLLDNQAQVNDADKLRVQYSLHNAASVMLAKIQLLIFIASVTISQFRTALSITPALEVTLKQSSCC